MVKEVHTEQEALYECEECHFKYREQTQATQCQTWCAEHHSCNLAIIQYAVTENTRGGDTHG